MWESCGAIVLAGGRATRLGGVDKAGIELHGRTLLAHALDAVVDAADVVVVGDPVPTERPVTFVREDPAFGGPVAALGAGLEHLAAAPWLVVLAVDMPRVTFGTVQRLRRTAAQGGDGAVLVDPDGRRQLAFVARRDAVAAAVPGLEERHGLPLRVLLDALRLIPEAARGEEHRDVDGWDDLRDLADA